MNQCIHHIKTCRKARNRYSQKEIAQGYDYASNFASPKALASINEKVICRTAEKIINIQYFGVIFMKHKLLLLTLAALLMAVAGTQADDDLLWTKNLDPHHICGVYFAYDDSVAVAVADGGIFLYNSSSGELLKSIDVYNKVKDVHYSYKAEGENQILTLGTKLAMWDLDKGDTLWTRSEQIGFSAISKKQPIIYSLTGDDFNNELIISDKFTGVVLEVKKINGLNGSAQIYLSQNEKYLFINGWTGSGFVKLLYDLENSKLNVIDLDKDQAYSVSFSPDGKYVAAGGEEKVRIWNLETMKIEKIIDIPSFCYAVKFSRDSKYFFYGDNSSNYWLHIVKISGWEKIKSYKQFPYFIDTKDDISILNSHGSGIISYNKSFLNIEDDNSNMTLFPNPTTNLVNIKLEQLSFEPINISIYDEMGSLVTTIFDGIAEQTDFVWSTEAVTSGVYFCVIKSKSSSKSYKIIVTK